MTGRFDARVLGVHGIRNHVAGETAENVSGWLAESLYDQLRRTLTDLPGFVGLGLSVEAPYFAHLLNEDRVLAHGPQPLPGQWLKPDPATWDFFLDLAVTWRNDHDLTEDEAVDVMVDKCGIDRQGLTLLTRRHWRELTTYLADTSVRAAVTTVVQKQIIQFRPDVVIGHDLGALVAYEALSRSETPATRLVTLGAPWGSRWVHRLLGAANQSLPHPYAATDWADLYSLGDAFCAGRPVSGPWRQHAVRDAVTVRHDHDRSPYLADPQLGDLLLELLRSASQEAAALRGQASGVRDNHVVFISHADNEQDLKWADWIAYELESAGYEALVKAWDVVPGMSSTQHTHDGVQRAERMIAVLTQAYLDSVEQSPEWQAMLRRDVLGKKRRLIPVRVEDCPKPGLLDVHGVDLFELTETDASNALRDGIAASVKGDNRPPPGERPRFPGKTGHR